eukprot:15026821-Heterocapsa_arctica.AAC.1
MRGVSRQHGYCSRLRGQSAIAPCCAEDPRAAPIWIHTSRTTTPCHAPPRSHAGVWSNVRGQGSTPGL